MWDHRLFFPGACYRFFSVQLPTTPGTFEKFKRFSDHTCIAHGVFLREVLEAAARLAASVMSVMSTDGFDF